MNVALIRSSRARSNHNNPRFTDIALAVFAIVLISALLIPFWNCGQNFRDRRLGSRDVGRDPLRLVADLSVLGNPPSSVLEILLVRPPVEEIWPNRDVLKELQCRS
jgi:hypothetical protein